MKHAAPHPPRPPVVILSGDPMRAARIARAKAAGETVLIFGPCYASGAKRGQPRPGAVARPA